MCSEKLHPTRCKIMILLCAMQYGVSRNLKIAHILLLLSLRRAITQKIAIKYISKHKFIII